MTPSALDCVGVGARTLVKELCAVVDGALCAAQQSPMTVLPGSIHACITAVKVSAVLSGMGTRNVLPDSRSTPPNTHCSLTGWPLWYLRRMNLPSSISTVLLGPPIFSEQPSMYMSMVFLQNWPQSAIVVGLKRCSSLIREAGSRRTMSYVRNITSWKVRLLCWNHEAFLIDLDSEHTATDFLRHLHLKPSRLGSAHQIISRPQVLHVTLLRVNPTPFRNWMPRSMSMKRYVKIMIRKDHGILFIRFNVDGLLYCTVKIHVCSLFQMKVIPWNILIIPTS